ncbi:MAG: hypothetical protein OHK0029_11310 [Armatimonadaceae bacterium]
METETLSPLPWLVVLLPLLGFLILAFIGAGVTKEPKPVVETEPAPHPTPVPGQSPYAMETEEEPVSSATGVDDDATVRMRPVRVDETVEVTEPDKALPHHDGDPHHGHSDSGAQLSSGGKALVGGLATLMVFLSFVVSVMLFFQVQNGGGHSAGEAAGEAGHHAVHRIFSTAFEWMPQAGLNFQLMVDPLTALMMLVITGVGTLIHLYSIGYMGHDRGFARYFSYLNLFVFFMLLLVMGANLVVTFVGWEGVGLASYLLIGFYHTRKSANDAAKKAFIVNRVGDCAFLIAMFALYKSFGTLDLYGANGLLTEAGMALANAQGYEYVKDLVPLLLFLGAAGKSAQIPLYVWLPDAMEGPTPVSALIHAATMVTGGVYLVSRTHELFLLSPISMTVVAVVGLVTAFLAATIALTQDDIKKVLAYSTVSQLGYMFLACGVGAFGAAMFHVFTHAFFKALLFLGAGSVIHAMHGEQDMRRMGGLRAKMPITFFTMAIGTLAIAGFPGLAGFFSKDEILLNAFAGPANNGLGHWSLWLVGWLTAGMTAFYMTRLLVKTFWGTPRHSAEEHKKVHESPATMWIPLAVLAVLSIGAGYLNATIIKMPPFFESFLGETVEWRAEDFAFRAENIKLGLAGASILIALAGIGLAFTIFSKGQVAVPKGIMGWFSQMAYNKWQVDEAYDSEIVKPGANLSYWLWRNMDVRVIDGVVNGSGGLVSGLSNRLKDWQSGYVRNYALSMLVGVVLVLIGSLIALRLGIR